jgi:hypothetical protein
MWSQATNVEEAHMMMKTLYLVWWHSESGATAQSRNEKRRIYCTVMMSIASVWKKSLLKLMCNQNGPHQHPLHVFFAAEEVSLKKSR